MQIYKGLSTFALVYFISIVQLIALSLHIYQSGNFFLEVPTKARKLLFLRSTIYAIGIICFVQSLKFVSPVTALIV